MYCSYSIHMLLYTCALSRFLFVVNGMHFAVSQIIPISLSHKLGCHLPHKMCFRVSKNNCNPSCMKTEGSQESMNFIWEIQRLSETCNLTSRGV